METSHFALTAPSWKELYRIGGVAALLSVLLIPIQVAIFVTWPPPVSVMDWLALSSQYTATGTEAERAMLLAAGQAMLLIYKGTAFDVYYVFNAAALLILAVVMLRSTVFSNVTGYWGLASGILMTIPSTAGGVGMLFALASLVPWVVFCILIARRLFRLGRPETA